VNHPLKTHVPESLHPRYDSNGTLTFHCPRCFADKRKRAYSYSNNPGRIYCSSTGCIRGEKFSEIFGADYKPPKISAPKTTKRRKKSSPIPSSKLDQFILSNRGHRMTQAAKDYIHSRLPGLDKEKALRLFFAIDKSPYALDKYHVSKGFLFGIPLFSHDSTRAVSYQVYHPHKKPKAKTCVSLGASGAGFYPSIKLADKALIPAPGERSHFLLAEGVFDFATLRLLGKNVQGIAGVSQAAKSIRAMKEHGFEGAVYLALDADEAGAREISKLEQLFRFDPSICLYDASPKKADFPELFEKHPRPDINDLYVFYEQLGPGEGQGAVERLIQKALPLFNEENEGRRKLKIAHSITRKIGAYESPARMEGLLEYFRELGVSPRGKKLFIEDLGVEIDRASNVGKLYRAAHCGALGWHTCDFDPEKFDETFSLSKKNWAAENSYCHHCLAQWWNSVVVPELLKKWPEKLFTLTIPFSTREDLEGKKRKILARIKSQVSRHIGYSVNTIEGCLYIYTDIRPGEVKERKRPRPSNPILDVPSDITIPPLLRRIKEATRIQYMDREDVIKGPFKASWFSTPRYVQSIVREAISERMGFARFSRMLKTNPFLAKKLARYGFRKQGRLEIPTLESFRADYRSLCKEIRDRQEEIDEKQGSGEGSDEETKSKDKSISRIKMHVLSHETSRTFYYMSYRAPSKADVKKLLHQEELKVRLGDEPNYLRVTHTWPELLRMNKIKPVDIARKIARHNGWSDFSIFYGTSKLDYETDPTPREQIEAYYLDLNEKGYDPRIHGSESEFLASFRETKPPPDT